MLVNFRLALPEEIKTFQRQIIELLKKMKVNNIKKINTAKEEQPDESPEDKTPSQSRSYHLKELDCLMKEELLQPKSKVKYFTQQTLEKYKNFLIVMNKFMKIKTRPKSEEE